MTDTPLGIEIFSGFYDKEFCEQGIKILDTAQELKMTRTRQEHDQVPKHVKEDNSYFIPNTFPLEHTDKEYHAKFNTIFWEKVYPKYLEKYSVLETFDKHSIYTMKMQKTPPGGGYHAWHAEYTSRVYKQRLATWTIYLNDDFEAGETEFLYQQYRYKPKQGDCLIFPASYTHTHRGNPPIGGDKYIITGWVEF